MVEPLILRDEQAGASASIAPALGFNCYSFQVRLGDQPHEALWSHPEFLAGTQKPSRSGIPVLFPFAGRIRGTSFEFEGRAYELPVGDDFGNAIHGFVMTRPWRVTHRTALSATGEFQASLDAPDVLANWPADYRIEATYRLHGNSLTLAIQIENPDSRPLPFWFGTHPYFRVPLVTGGDPAQSLAHVPASAEWELADMLPTGRVINVPDHADLRNPRPFNELKVDDILTGLQFTGELCEPGIRDTASGHRLWLEFGHEFSECVVFVPPHREALCIEPYTSVSNAFELEAKGLRTGLRILEPLETFECEITIRVE